MATSSRNAGCAGRGLYPAGHSLKRVTDTPCVIQHCLHTALSTYSTVYRTWYFQFAACDLRCIAIVRNLLHRTTTVAAERARGSMHSVNNPDRSARAANASLTLGGVSPSGGRTVSATITAPAASSSARRRS